ncbi:MAG: hydrogenase [Acidocella sp.]|nr:hydrogenase [Acidocella sp.]
MSTDTLTASLRRLLQMLGVSALDTAGLDAFIADGVTALFFTGNATRYPEIDDLAVVLPELMKEFPGAFRVGVIDPDAERKLAVRFKISVRPTLVFLRRGEVIASLPRMRDWGVYLDEIAAILTEQA